MSDPTPRNDVGKHDGRQPATKRAVPTAAVAWQPDEELVLNTRRGRGVAQGLAAVLVLVVIGYGTARLLIEWPQGLGTPSPDRSVAEERALERRGRETGTLVAAIILGTGLTLLVQGALRPDRLRVAKGQLEWRRRRLGPLPGPERRLVVPLEDIAFVWRQRCGPTDRIAITLEGGEGPQIVVDHLVPAHVRRLLDRLQGSGRHIESNRPSFATHGSGGGYGGVIAGGGGDGAGEGV